MNYERDPHRHSERSRYFGKSRNLFVVLILIAAIVVLIAVLFYLTRNKPVSGVIGEDIKSREEISAIILPHFDFAKLTRQKMLEGIKAKTDPDKIIVVSVNHFNVGQDQIQTTNRQWSFQDASPKTDQDMVRKLETAGLAKIEDASFENEHGIKNVLPDLAKTFPNASFSPLIIKNGTDKEKLDQAIEFLKTNCQKCLLVASVDFSHYNPDLLAQLHDTMSLRALQKKDSDLALGAETDSPETFYLLEQWAKQFEDQNFNLYAQNNSGRESNDRDMETVSYIMGDYRSGAQTPAAEKSTTFIFAGDLMFDRLINHQFNLDGGLNDLFNEFGNRVFWGTDIAFANLEGPISPDPISDDTSTDNLIFNFPPETVQALKFLKINGVSLANNHSLNAGGDGFASTKEILNAAKITVAGSQNKVDEQSLARFDGGIPVSIIAVNFLESPDISKIEDMVKSEKSASRFTIVYPHWGSEYQLVHGTSQQQQAHKLIEAGADLVVGSHPHVVEDVEIYQNKPIIYSLGNLVFDQTFSRDTQVGLLLGGKITKNAVELSFFPTEQVKLKPRLSVGQNKQDLLERIFKNSGIEFTQSGTIKLTR